MQSGSRRIRAGGEQLGAGTWKGTVHQEHSCAVLPNAPCPDFEAYPSGKPRRVLSPLRGASGTREPWPPEARRLRLGPISVCADPWLYWRSKPIRHVTAPPCARRGFGKRSSRGLGRCAAHRSPGCGLSDPAPHGRGSSECGRSLWNPFVPRRLHWRTHCRMYHLHWALFESCLGRSHRRAQRPVGSARCLIYFCSRCQSAPLRLHVPPPLCSDAGPCRFPSLQSHTRTDRWSTGIAAGIAAQTNGGHFVTQPLFCFSAGSWRFSNLHLHLFLRLMARHGFAGCRAGDGVSPHRSSLAVNPQ